MIDFRYHALSLVAVFVALVIGLLLGVAIGDSGLVSSAERNLREDLRSDVRDAQAESARLREELERRSLYEELTLPRLVGERLEGRRVHLIFVGERSETVFDSVRSAVETAGGRLGLVGTLAGAVDLEALAGAAAGTRFDRLAEDPSLLDDLGRRLGEQLVGGGRLLDAVRDPLLSASSGAAEPASGLVVYRAPDQGLEGDELDRAGELVDGLLAGALTAGGSAVGVEETATDPSQVSWYRDRGLASVDNVDVVPGHAALAVVLAGQAEGAYGVKSTRDAYLPDELVRLP